MNLYFKNITASVFIIFSIVLIKPSIALNSADSFYLQAINHGERIATDFKFDEIRKPSQILPFTQIKPGDIVLELGAGGGYTTELLSRVVGDKGKVFAHRLYKKDRLKDNRLANVVSLRDHSLFELAQVLKENHVAKESLNSIVIFFALHDIYLNSEMNNSVLKSFYDYLKPGGALIILDNAAKPDSGLAATKTLHRIGESFVITEMKNAGFKVDSTSDVLRNKNDDHSKPWGDFKGKQDRFAIRFVK